MAESVKQANEQRDDTAGADPQPGATPVDALGIIASQDVLITPNLRHVELFTRTGLMSVLWHQPDDESVASSAPAAIIACGGAMGGLLGPADGLYQRLGQTWAGRGAHVLRVDYRQPNDLDACCVDVAATVQLAVVGGGAERVVVIGHSFGGAVAVRVAVALADVVSGVVTLATQSAGCELAGGLAGRPLLLFHGDCDEILPLQASEVVQAIAGEGELVVCAGDGHLLSRSAALIEARLDPWLSDVLVG